MADFTVAKIDEIDAIQGFATFRRARSVLGVSAFGLSIIDMPPKATGYPEHDHSSDGQEEVYVVLSGSGEVEIDGERHPLDAEHVIRVGPDTRRKIFPGEDGLRLLAVGGVPGEAYDAESNHPTVRRG